MPPFSLRLGHARGKTTLSCFLTPSRRYATHWGRLKASTYIKNDTILGLCDIAVFDGAEGEDYSKLLISGMGNRPESVPFIQMKRKGVRTKKYMFAVTSKNEHELGETFLFDIDKDPYQKNNLALTDIPEEELLKLRKLLGYWLARSNDPWYKKRLYSDFIIYP